jgi:hypothetical protein
LKFDVRRACDGYTTLMADLLKAVDWKDWLNGEDFAD